MDFDIAYLQRCQGYLDTDIEIVPGQATSASLTSFGYVYLPIMPQADIANTGIFEAQGAVIFDVIEERPVDSVVSLEDIYSSFKDRITVIAEGTEVEVSRISLAYLPSTLQNGNRLLVPAWAFECTDRRIENGRSVTNKISVLFRADNGDYWDVFF